MTDSCVDIALTNHLIDRLANMSSYQTDAVQLLRHTSTPDVFNGHIVLIAPRPSGGIVILAGEFPNDGLAAAVGALPVGEVFYRMVEKGFSLSDIIDELNQKLLFILPENMYLSACLIELEREAKILYVWNGGMPDLIIADKNQKLKYRAPSVNYPLGFSNELEIQPVFFEVSDGDSAYSYGQKTDTTHADVPEPYRNDELERLLLTKNAKSLDDIALSLTTSEVSLVKLKISELNHLDTDLGATKRQQSLPPSNWNMNFNFQASTLRNIEIVPIMINALMQIQAPQEHKQRIYTVITELCNNALDHGVLDLSSELKATSNGFSEYYKLRGHRLAELTKGYINVNFTHQAMSSGGKLIIDVEDSGKGFEYKQESRPELGKVAFSGRGLTLLNQLCNKVSFLGVGNQVRVEYLWS